MRQEVRSGFVAFTARFEGVTDWFYLDVRGLVSIGLGNLVDPIALAQSLDYTQDGAPASWHDVTASWMAVSAKQDWKLRGGGAFEHLQGNRVRATRESIMRLFGSKLDRFEADVKRAFADWEAWPAEAQTATLSLCWAMGSGFIPHWPAWSAACLAQNWALAAEESHMDDAQNPGLRPRNRANRALFLSAAEKGMDVTDAGADRPVFAAPDPQD